MITTLLRPFGRKANTIRFASTLYLCPILDLLLAKIPRKLHAELRLGLQEALVNAVKHGNSVDPAKTIVVRFSVTKDSYEWAISDEGVGFPCPQEDSSCEEYLPPSAAQCGRGLFILQQVFDRVDWSADGTEVRLCKHIRSDVRIPTTF